MRPEQCGGWRRFHVCDNQICTILDDALYQYSYYNLLSVQHLPMRSCGEHMLLHFYIVFLHNVPHSLSSWRVS